MAIFDWVIAGSGAPGVYGVSTINTNSPIKTFSPASRIITVVPASGSCDYYDLLDTRFKAVASGWND